MMVTVMMVMMLATGEMDVWSNALMVQTMLLVSRTMKCGEKLAYENRNDERSRYNHSVSAIAFASHFHQATPRQSSKSGLSKLARHAATFLKSRADFAWNPFEVALRSKLEDPVCSSFDDIFLDALPQLIRPNSGKSEQDSHKNRRNWAVLKRVSHRRDQSPVYFLQIIVALCPPKPKLLFMA